MRKTLLDRGLPAQGSHNTQDEWLDIDTLATVEITSEDPEFPIERALSTSETKDVDGWRAAARGPQLIRLTFDAPTDVRRVHLHFVERACERSQEIAVYAASHGGGLREAVRQQFTFSPGGAVEEVEDYAVNLTGVTSLELRIDPDRAHDPTHSQHFATLQRLRLA